MTLPEHAAAFAESNGFIPEIITKQRLPGTAGALDGRTGLVLFGDNYYHGIITHTSGFTTSYRDCEGLAVVCGQWVAEKPHRFTGRHLCFTGYCFVYQWKPLQLSVRGEYEITDLLVGPKPLDVDWEHFSDPSDYERVLQYVKDCQNSSAQLPAGGLVQEERPSQHSEG